ncbi:MAG TPA: hypothetical protein DCM64_07920 [Gammaproteobacteria bacterium]|jgi:hypothetical protein|nr:hypothetical protein [Gammaproteobacteria bacterium]|tara:strand:- start:2184 stop:2831 length:648 start_codon:yes stop_codon:yes gene_type:complete
MSVTVRSLPSVLLIGMFVYPVLTDSYLPFTSRELLGVIVQIEWLVLATGLLLLFAMLVPTTTRIGKCIALAYVLIVSMGFALTGALEMDGWRGFIAYFSLLFVNYGLSTLLPNNRAGYADTLLYAGRRVVLMFVFFGLVGAIGFPTNVANWRGSEAELLGAIFFTVMTVVDLGVFPYVQAIIEREFRSLTNLAKGELERARGRRLLYGMRDRDPD